MPERCLKYLWEPQLMGIPGGKAMPKTARETARRKVEQSSCLHVGWLITHVITMQYRDYRSRHVVFQQPKDCETIKFFKPN